MENAEIATFFIYRFYFIVVYISLLKKRSYLYAYAMRKVRLRIKEVAKAQGISMTKLHTRSEVAYSTIRKIFHDPYTDITLTTLARLAEVLGVETKDLLEDVQDGD